MILLLIVTSNIVFEDYFAGRELTKLPKVVADQIADEQAEAEDAADEA